MRINASQFRQLVNQQKNMASRRASPRKGKQGKKKGKVEGAAEIYHAVGRILHVNILHGDRPCVNPQPSAHSLVI